jgi:hypothetical protein
MNGEGCFALHRLHEKAEASQEEKRRKVILSKLEWGILGQQKPRSFVLSTGGLRD